MIYPSMLFAQSLYSNADMLAMRWLDYLRVTDALTSLESAVEAGQITGERLLGRLLGRDLTGEKARAWLVSLLDSSGTDELDYRYICELSLDMEISVQDLDVALRNATGGWTDGEDEWALSSELPGCRIFRRSKMGCFLQ